MAKRRKVSLMPVQGGVRRSSGMAPKSSGGTDNTVISYNVPSTVLGTAAGQDYVRYSRDYIPGSAVGLSLGVGPGLVDKYSSAKFLPGTKVRWEPSVSFNTTGRVFVGFADNPEVVVGSVLLTDAQFASFIRGLGNVVSFPVWQETEINFPTKLRRKRFDTNKTASSNVDVFDRCNQTTMFVWIEGMPASTNAGTFWFHDRIDVEGLHNIIT